MSTPQLLPAERTAGLVAANGIAERDRLEERLRETEALLAESRTARLQAEEQLRRTQGFLTQSQKLSRLGNFCWRLSTGEIEWSEPLYRIFELEPGRTVTLDLIRSRIHPEDVPLLDDMIASARRAVGDFEYTHRLLLPGGAIRHLHLVAHATRDSKCRLEYVGAVRDMTQWRASQEALAKASAELVNAARLSRMGVAMAAVAHEINQPLSGIVINTTTCLRMLSAEPPNVDGAREAARRAIRDGGLARDVIARLMTLYGRKPLDSQAMDLNAVACGVISLFLSELQRNRVLLRQDLAADLPPVRGDRVQLQLVILNLLRNASEAMSAIESRPRELVITTEWNRRDRVRLSVRDAGIGFLPEAASVLFEAFYTTKSDGMGLGLCISRTIVEAHRGQLWATANEGPGATFGFSLPCEPYAQSEPGG